MGKTGFHSNLSTTTTKFFGQLVLKRYQCLLTEPRKRECETVFFSFDQHSSIKGLIQEWEDENQQFLILVWQIMKFMLETVFRWNISLYDNCQRPVFSPGVSQHMHKIINLSKFSLIGRRSCENKNERKTPLSHKLCALTCLNSRLQPRFRNQLNYFTEKLRLSQKLRYLRGSRLSQCFKLPTARHCSLPSKFLC